MVDLGKKNDRPDYIFRPLKVGSKVALSTTTEIFLDDRGKPEEFPKVSENELVVAGCDRGLGEEEMVICDTFEEMIIIWAKYLRGALLSIKWYAATFAPKD